ncbi:unnamed protein product [Fraxinus pennsylvanica]|uniref:NADP-dependent oxidoreductase domain-containing protein n=1 Tax=Fraxinus pennsylvanica TaxID=56036 RepID=A0AAD1ZUN2_9LAMI|nr:unnamed protein product [Fraxinus pennsylvanica]
MASSSCSVIPGFISNNRNLTYTLSRRNFTRHLTPPSNGGRKLGLYLKKKKSSIIVSVKGDALQYRKLGDSDLVISEITMGTMTFGEQNTEKEAHELLSYSFENGINAIDTAEMYPVPVKKETQGRTDLYIGSWLKSRPRDKVILATKVAGYSEQTAYLRDDAKVIRSGYRRDLSTSVLY